ncbi:MAG: ABC transporter permease [Methanosphaera sp.]|nr:ABC transporter permease [Methanosphaera sp.]
MLDKAEFKTVVSSEFNRFDFHLKDVWSYKDLIGLFVKRDFTSKYKQTILGPAWAVIQPLLTTIVFTFIFGNIAGLADCGAVPSFLFYMLGNILWGYFSGCLTGTSSTFIANAGIMGKVYYPRLVMPISTVLTNLISFAIQFVMFVVFMLFMMFVPDYQMQPNLLILMLPVIILEMAMLGLGFGIIAASMTTKYRDLNMLIGFGVQLWMYGTPIAYSISIFEKSPIIYKLININPMTPIVQIMRYAFLGEQAAEINWTYYGISWIITLCVLFIGIFMFNKVERTFMDTV